MISDLGGWEKVIWHLTPVARKLFSSTFYHLRLLIFGRVLCWKRQPSGGGKKKGHHFFEKATSLHLAKSFKYMLALGPSDSISENLPKEVIQNTSSSWRSAARVCFFNCGVLYNGEN